jgi:multidrug efflux pump
LQEEGKNVREAVIESAALRLRPILMTTGAMVLGAIPLAIASGAGAYARQQLGVVIVGGMTIGTIFSLVIVPIVYTLLAEKRSKMDDSHPINIALQEAEK